MYMYQVTLALDFVKMVCKADKKDSDGGPFADMDGAVVE